MRTEIERLSSSMRLSVWTTTSISVARRDCVARLSRRSRSGHLSLLLRQADVLWTSKFHHSVQRFDGDHDLARSALIGARS